MQAFSRTIFILPVVILAAGPTLAQDAAGEAKASCDRAFASYRLKAGSGWLAGYRIRNNPFTPVPGAPKERTDYILADGVSSSTSTTPLSPTDSRNGYQWKGAIFYQAKNFRVFQNGRWSDWQPPGRAFSCFAEKRNGQWKIGVLDGMMGQPSKLIEWFRPTSVPR